MSKLDDEARQILKDSFARDMAGHQLRTGKLPTPDANARLAVPLFERIEQKQAAKPAPVKAEAPKRKERPKGKAVRLPEGKQSDLPERFHTFAAQLWERVLLLTMGVDMDGAIPKGLWHGWNHERGPKGQPSWFERILSAKRTHMVDRRRGVAELVEVCEDSSRLLGDWKKPKPQRLIIG